MVSGQNRRQKMRGVASLGLFNDGIALRHALKAVNGLSNTAEKGTSQKKNTEETRHIRNLLNSGHCLRGFARVWLHNQYKQNRKSVKRRRKGFFRQPVFLTEKLGFSLDKNHIRK